MRDITFKNYLVYAILCIVTLFLLMLFINKLKSIDVPVGQSVLSGTIYEINSGDIFNNIENYAIDNPDFFLYISNANEESFELDFKEYITDNNLDLSIIYINGWNQLDIGFVKDFKNKFFVQDLLNVDVSYLQQSNVYLFKNGKIADLLYKQKSKINLGDVEKFIEGFDIYD